MSGLLGVSEARRKLLESFAPVSASRLPLPEARGRVLAAEVISELDIPHFANSSMDGFAVRAEDLVAARPDSPVALQVCGDIPAGVTPEVKVKPGQAARIMTGAPLPEGADAVIPVEDTDFNERNPGAAAPEWMKAYRPVKPGENVRPAGQDIQVGELALPANIRLRPQEVAFLAALGVSDVLVYRRPRLALLSSGDELLPLGAPLQPGKIYDSNMLILSELAKTYGAEPFELGIAGDSEAAVESLLDQAIEMGVDLIVSTAGVSVGAFDFVRSVVEKHGQIGFWRVNMRPGKPLAFGKYRKTPLIGLPGNPVSAYVGFEVFVRPALMKLGGMGANTRPAHWVKLQEPLESDGRESYLRAIVTFEEGRWQARLTGHQGSGNLRSLVRANALLIVPSGVKSLPVGAEVEAWFMEEPSPGNFPG